MSVAEANKRYKDAKEAFRAAAEELRRAVAREAADVSRNNFTKPTRKRTWREAREMAKKVHAMKAAHPDYSQAELGKELGLDVSMVCYFLRSPKYVGILNEA